MLVTLANGRGKGEKKKVLFRPVAAVNRKL
jgi:hypothetical protein